MLGGGNEPGSYGTCTWEPSHPNCAYTGYDLTAASEGSTFIYNFSVTGVDCATNYIATATGQPVASVCSSDGAEYILSGCREQLCVHPPAHKFVDGPRTDTASTGNCDPLNTGPLTLEEAERQCSLDASCQWLLDDGCGGATNWRICGWQVQMGATGTASCTRLKAGSTGYDHSLIQVTNSTLNTTLNLQVPWFSVEFSSTGGCSTDYHGGHSASNNYFGVPATTVCSGDGLEYTLSGCMENVCVRPWVDPVGYDLTARVETSLVAHNFSVTGVSCAAQYVPWSPINNCDWVSPSRHGYCDNPQIVAPEYVNAANAQHCKSMCESRNDCGGGYFMTPGTHSSDPSGGDAGCYLYYRDASPGVSGPSTCQFIPWRNASAFENCRTTTYPTVSACTDHTYEYEMWGCRAETCVLPPATAGYDLGLVVARNVQIPFFDVNFSPSGGCAVYYHGGHDPSNNYFGVPTVSICAGDYLPFTVSGCFEDECSRPTITTAVGLATTGYNLSNVTETSLMAHNFSVTGVECADMFIRRSAPTAIPCTSHTTSYVLTGCSPEQCFPADHGPFQSCCGVASCCRCC